MKTGIERIADERRRQVEEHGWTPEHDAKHEGGELAQAAVCYAQYAAIQERVGEQGRQMKSLDVWNPIEDLTWPLTWHASWWRPSADSARNLEKAGALIAAALDRHVALRKPVRCPCKPRTAGAARLLEEQLGQAPPALVAKAYAREPRTEAPCAMRSCAEILADVLQLRHPHDEALPLADMLPDELATEACRAVKRAQEDKLIETGPDRYYHCGICGELHDEQSRPSTEDVSVGRSALAHYGDEVGEQQTEG